MNAHSKYSSIKPKVLGSACLVDPVEEFEAKLREENLYFYRKFILKNTIVQVKNQYPKIWRQE